MASVSLRGVQKAYGNNPPVIRDVDLEIGENEFCVFLGPSGCGKSTLLRMIAGLEDLSDGDLLIGGREVNDVPAAERGVAMVFQSYALFPHMSVYENMSFGLKLAKKSKSEIDTRVREAARVLQLDALLERKPRELSGGQRQRVAIGRAIVREPGVFLFDEPLSNLDATLRGQTRIEIARLHKQFASASVVYVTHDQTEAMTLADKIVLLHAGADTARHGSIAQVGAPLELYHRPASRFVAGFIGSPRMNFLAATVSAVDAQGVTATLVQTGEAMRVAVDGTGLQENEPVTVGVRPEHLELSAGDARDAGGTLTRTVSLTEHLGEHSYVHLEQPDRGVLIAKVPGNVQVDRGQRVSFVARPDVCHLFTQDDFSVKPLAAVAHTL
ncbi:sn-glycerol-3-phosphate ABC transporter ATP-binding protein UgpC [Caballeronia sp. LZ034LL]|uniref:ABC transporter ATP-binding protein n=1 Tax=Caballeronia sp. LZ034LL TaxID=3038567 RepID=UPI002859A49D|nr:sn-glycerol-3-phosphate ABC transporter ATP-binding protein UgpC [Caballeronia sp. LZ034LL]MDR5835867.1 sn-glycerol-3-phosphate ABC transporter ATP-binding protein UgpC [Caballeronia sp. LZ034LL]